MARTTDDPKGRTLGIRLSERDHAALTMLASGMDRSRGDVLRALIRQAAAVLGSSGASSLRRRYRGQHGPATAHGASD